MTRYLADKARPKTDGIFRIYCECGQPYIGFYSYQLDKWHIGPKIPKGDLLLRPPIERVHEWEYWEEK